MLRVSDPDTLIAERLSGQAPFMARDPFFDGPEPSAPSAAPEAEAPAEEAADLAPAAEPVPEGEVEPPAVEAPIAEAPPAAPGPRAAAGADEIDLTGALGNLDEAPAAAPSGALDQAFARIRTDAETEGDYSSQHMTLARTYLEIGMVDEAIGALQTAVRSPRQRFEAAAMLGRVYERRGEQPLAIEWMERAAEASPPSADEGRQLLYDLGVLLDAAGETSRALAVFLELQSEAGDYRDVPGRIDRLARVQTGG
jgi:tetratricopeptide (TPR) repeat protein